MPEVDAPRERVPGAPARAERAVQRAPSQAQSEQSLLSRGAESGG